MNKNQIVFVVVFTLINTISYSQKLTQEKVAELTQILNNSIAAKIQFKLEDNKGYFNLGKFNKTLDVRNNFEITKDSVAIKTKQKPKENKPYAGTMYWKYNFKQAINSGVEFRANKFGKIFFTILFKNLDTISVKSSLNAYTSHHKISDSAPHVVDWTGDKYISLLLSPEKINDIIKYKVMGVTVSGKFERKDKKPIAKEYSKSLRKILRKEFENLFESEELNLLLTQ